MLVGVVKAAHTIHEPKQVSIPIMSRNIIRTGDEIGVAGAGEIMTVVNAAEWLIDVKPGSHQGTNQVPRGVNAIPL